jgi:hypothetical protein
MMSTGAAALPATPPSAEAADISISATADADVVLLAK